MSFQSLLAELIRSFTAQQTRAFLEAIQSLKQEIDVPRLRRALAINDIEAAIDAMNIEPSAFMDYQVVMQGAYREAGKLAMEHFPPPPDTKIAIRFDMSNPRAEDWLRRVGAERVVELSDEQRRNVRQVILDAYSRGAGPDEISTSLAGKINPQTGKRHGGVLGLSDAQLGFSDTMRRRLESGNPAEMSKVLRSMSLRDKRYDRTIRKAIAEGRPVDSAKIAEMTRQYENRLLQSRAKLVARTEVGMATMESKMESWRQGLDKTGYPEEAVKRTWRHGGGGHDPRPQHVEMNGVSVAGLTTPFTLPDGTQMLHALDSAGGAKHCANCTCTTDFEIDYSYGVT